METLGEPLERFYLNKSRVKTKLYVLVALFIVLTNFLGIDNLVDRIYVAVMMIHLLFLWYQASRTVLVFRSGIYFNSRFVPWHDIFQITQTDKKLILNLRPNGSQRLVNRDILDIDELKSVVHQFQTTVKTDLNR